MKRAIETRGSRHFFKAVPLVLSTPLFGLFLLEIIRRSTQCGGSCRAATIAPVAYDFGDFMVDRSYRHGNVAARVRAIRLVAPRRRTSGLSLRNLTTRFLS